MATDGDPVDEETARRRMCQACFRDPAEHHCQACRRFVCDGCVQPPGEAELLDTFDELETFLQSAMTRCRACRDESVRLPAHEVELETA